MYYGFVIVGYVILEVNNVVLNGKEVYYIKGEGWIVGVLKWFFNVEDYY